MKNPNLIILKSSKVTIFNNLKKKRDQALNYNRLKIRYIFGLTFLIMINNKFCDL